jgi:pseudouridine-5'-monophosphatase
MFNHVASGSDIATELGKPAPDIFLRCAKMFGSDDLDSSRCLVFEDAPAGVEAARAAGMKVVMVPDRNHVKEEQCRKATFVLNSLLDFVPQSFGLPPYNYSKVTHVIFDVDGLMIDSVRMAMKVMMELLKEHGVDPDEKFLKSQCGMKNVDKIKKIKAHFGLSVEQDSFLREYNKRGEALCSNLDLLEGVERLVLHLHRHGIPIAVATNSGKIKFNGRTERHRNVFSKMHHVITGDDARLRNAKPDIYLMCAEDFNDNVAPSQCLVFEDSNIGVAAAFAAGMQCVHVPQTNFLIPREAAKATQMISSLAHFRPEEFGLPPFDD